MLRLFPALFVLVLVGSLFNMDHFDDVAIWHILQMSNVYFAISEGFKPWVTAHLWSLNALEQFYLVWPLVILLLPLKRIYGLVIGIVVAMIIIRTHTQLLGIGGWWGNMVFVSDPIAFGAFCYLLQRQTAIAEVIRSWPALIASLLVIASPLLIWDAIGALEAYRILIQPALCVVVAGAFHGYRGPVGWLLDNQVARFLSKISYGAFIYHLGIWWLVAETFPQLYKPGPMTFLILSPLTFAVATVSWYAMERPISQWKDRFPTATRSPQPRPTADHASAS